MIRWRDGFSIDGGELRLYSDPASREFMVGVEKRDSTYCRFRPSGFCDAWSHPCRTGEGGQGRRSSCGHGRPQVLFDGSLLSTVFYRKNSKIGLTRSREKLLLPGVSLHYNYNNITNEFHLREEEFVREKVKAKPFQGSGNVLGSIAPAVAPPAADASLDPKQVIYLDAT